MPDTTTTWTTDLKASAVKAARAKATAIDHHVTAGNRQFALAALDLESVYRFYLQGDKERLTNYLATEVRGIKPNMGYVYVQAGRVMRNPEAVGLDKAKAEGMAVQALAQFDRYVPTPGMDEAKAAEAKAEAVALIEADTAKAEAEGRKPLTADSLRETSKAIKAEATGEAPEDPTERRTGNIAMKLRDSYRDEVLTAVQILHDDKAGGYFAAFQFIAAKAAEWGAQYGAVTPAALNRLADEWTVDRKAAALAEARKAKATEAKAAKADEVQAALDTLRPAPAVAPAAQVKDTPKPAAPKRTNRRKAAGGTAALVAANAPRNGQ